MTTPTIPAPQPARRRRFTWKFWAWQKAYHANKVVPFTPVPRERSRFDPPPAGQLVVGPFKIASGAVMAEHRPKRRRKSTTTAVQLELFKQGILL